MDKKRKIYWGTLAVASLTVAAACSSSGSPSGGKGGGGGDAGTIDSNGYLKLTDRIKDVIKSGGEWISSIDMENAIMAHPAIVEAAVIGVPHPKWQERPVAIVVLKAGQNLSADAIHSHLSEHFAKWQLPEVIFADAVKRTSVGKADKKRMRAEYERLYLKETSHS